jgi:predicted regulator of Ras-like GTPase activity (Roadblock/LC7/MglB family)
LPKKELKQKLIEKELESLATITGVEVVVVIDDTGELISIAGTQEYAKDVFLTLVSLRHGICIKEGNVLNKGIVDEVDVIWENGCNILRNIDGKHILLAITSKNTNMGCVRNSMKKRLKEIQKCLGGVE